MAARSYDYAFNSFNDWHCSGVNDKDVTVVDDLVKIWPLVLALVAVIALVVEIRASTKENAKKIMTLFELHNEAVRRELNKK